MRAVVLHRHGDEDVLELTELPLPEPGPGQVRVRIRAAGVNHLDLDLRAGVSRYELSFPFVLGRESAGTVEAVGPGVPAKRLENRVVVATAIPCRSCADCLRGDDNLCADARHPGVNMQGGYAEYLVVPQSEVIPLGDDLDLVTAAALPVAFGTAWRMLVTHAQLRAGETVLVNGAGGGLGSAGIQVAIHLGARVIASAGSDKKLALARALGAEGLVNYQRADLATEVRRMTAGRGVDVAFEHIGGQLFRATLGCVAQRGRIVVAGAHAGEVVDIDLVPLFRRELRLFGSRGQRREEVDAVVSLSRRGVFAPVIDRVLPLGQAAEAHRLLAARQVVGKVVLIP